MTYIQFTPSQVYFRFFRKMIHSNKYLETTTDAYKFEISEKAKNWLGIPDSSQLGEACSFGTCGFEIIEKFSWW